MRNDNDDWREAKRDANRVGRFGIGWLVIVVLVIAALSAAGWGLSVALSAPKGQGEAYAQKNSAANWTAAQARFEDLYQEVLATDRKITVAADALALDPTDKTAQANHSGTVNYCIGVVGDYNAEARKYLAGDFKAADLPTEISNTNTETDCK
jgi:hypothetical protein